MGAAFQGQTREAGVSLSATNGKGKRCQGSIEGVVDLASAMGLVPEVGAGPGPRGVGGSHTAEDSSESSLEPQAPDYQCPQAGRSRRRPRCACASTSVHSKTSGHLFVFVCVRVCTPVLV